MATRTKATRRMQGNSQRSRQSGRLPLVLARMQHASTPTKRPVVLEEEMGLLHSRNSIIDEHELRSRIVFRIPFRT
jgi:hypothetical protein